MQLIPNAKKLPADSIGVVLLGRLAVDRNAQGQGLGTRMLLRAMRQTERAARDIGIHALVFDALDDAARAWYLKLDFGFQELLDDPRHLFLPVATIRQIRLQDHAYDPTAFGLVVRKRFTLFHPFCEPTPTPARKSVATVG